MLCLRCLRCLWVSVVSQMPLVSGVPMVSQVSPVSVVSMVSQVPLVSVVSHVQLPPVSVVSQVPLVSIVPMGYSRDTPPIAKLLICPREDSLCFCRRVLYAVYCVCPWGIHLVLSVTGCSSTGMHLSWS